MDWKNTMLRKMTVVMLGGVLLSPFVSHANDVAGHGSQTIGNGGAGNHMVISNQFNHDLDMTDIVMDGDHMSGNSLHDNGNGYMAETTRTGITMGNSGSGNSRTNGGRTWDDHHENGHGYSTTPTGGSYGYGGRSNGSANYHSSGSGMGGMH